ncbi:MAG: hypothetical protein R3C58_00590 [Parvularculaceae bacterium]
MKRAIARILLSKEVQLSPWGVVLRRFLMATRGAINYSAHFLMDAQALERNHYAYCMFGAAALARRLGHTKISAIELGVAGGNGLKFMCDFAHEVKKKTGVAVECYGFDTGKGMPAPDGAKDLPYWFKEAQYAMDEEALRRKVPDGRLVIGEVKDTIPSFLEKHNPAPIGAIFNDVDYWSSTRDSFALFDMAKSRPQNFLPRTFMYFDDILGWEYEMYGPFNGQLAAMHEYNASQSDVKIHLNQNLMPQLHLKYRHQIYYAHLFAHPDYNKYVGNADQEVLENALKLD